jgi:hypothetical protein
MNAASGPAGALQSPGPCFVPFIMPKQTYDTVSSPFVFGVLWIASRAAVLGVSGSLRKKKHFPVSLPRLFAEPLNGRIKMPVVERRIDWSDKHGT